MDINNCITKLNLAFNPNIKSKAEEYHRRACSKSQVHRDVVALPFACLYLAYELNCSSFPDKEAIKHSGMNKSKFHLFVNQVRIALNLEESVWTLNQITTLYGCNGILDACIQIHDCLKSKCELTLLEKKSVNLDCNEARLGVFFEICKVLGTKINQNHSFYFDEKKVKFFKDKLHFYCQADLDELKDSDSSNKRIKRDSTPNAKTTSSKGNSKTNTPLVVKSASKKPKLNPFKPDKWTTGIRFNTKPINIYESKEWAEYLIWKESILSTL